MDPAHLDLERPRQSALVDILRPYLQDTDSIPALGEKYVYRALEQFAGTSAARIVFQPAYLRQFELKTIRLSIEKCDSYVGVQHQFFTGWVGTARVGLTRYQLNIKIGTFHQRDSRRQPHSISNPPLTGQVWKSEYERHARFYPAFEAHHRTFEYTLSQNHENLKSLAYKSCAIAFEAGDGDPQCEPLQSVKYQIFATPIGDSIEERHAESSGITGPGLALSMNRHDYMRFRCTQDKETSGVSDKSRAYVALGSNMGDRTTMIERACQAMSQRNIKVLRTSSLYETEPKYVEDQRHFINGVCEVSALLSCQLNLDIKNLLFPADGR